MGARDGRSACGPGVLVVAAVGIAAAAVAIDAGFDLPAPLRAVLFAGWLAAVGVLGWCSLGRPGRRQSEAVAAGGLAGVAFVFVVACVPGGVRASRLAPPWGADPPPVRLTVTTGDPVVTRGTGVTVACVAETVAGGDRPPVRLELQDGESAPQTAGTAEELPGVFTARLPSVNAALKYRFTAGPVTTPWYWVAPADPVRLTGDTRLTTQPPAYAAGHYPGREFGPTDQITCLAGGVVSGQLAFDRPAERVQAEWQPADGSACGPVPVSVATNRTTAAFDLPTPADGHLLLTLTGAHGHQSAVRLPVRVEPDQPPDFIGVDGLEAGRWEVKPGEAVCIAVEVADDLWASAPMLELLAGPTPGSAKPTAVRLGGICGQYFARFALPPTTSRGGDRLFVRLRLTDRGPSGPAVFPVDEWAELTASDTAAPLAEQVIVVQRDRMAARLAAVEASLARLPVRPAGPADDLTRETHERLRHDALAVVARQLTAAAAAVRHVEELDPLAGRLRAAAGTPEAAGSVLSSLAGLNWRLSAERLDRARLRELVSRMQSLADRPPTDQRLVDQVVRTRDRLAAVTATSPRLTAARSATDHRGLTEAVVAAARLADDLDAATADLLAARAARAAPLAAKLAAVASQLEAAEATWAGAAGSVGRPTAPSLELRRAGELLGRGRLTESLPLLAAVTQRLTESAAEFARVADACRDPREAARQLLRWRADLDADGISHSGDEAARWDNRPCRSPRSIRPDARSECATLARVVRHCPPPAVEQLLDQDGAGRLATPGLAATARRLADRTRKLAEDVARLSAAADAPAADHSVAFRTAIDRLGLAFDRPVAPPQASGLRLEAVRELARPGDLADRWSAAATALRLIPCVVATAEPGDITDADLGQALADADAALAEALARLADGDAVEVRRAVRRAVARIEAAAR